MLNKNKILDVEITNDTEEKVLEYILQRLKSPDKFYIVTPNPEILVYANRHEKYKKILNGAEISLPDGTGLFLASIFMAKPFKERIPGIDFLDRLCKNGVRNGVSIGFLGGRTKVAEKTAECLLRKYPGLNIVFVGEEWDEAGFVHDGKSKIKDQRSKIELKIQNDQRPETRDQRPTIDLLFVAFGHPKQEEWIYNNLDRLPVKAAMGVGGAFDYISGTVARAPFLVRAIGFEWLYRLVREPWRWKRQLALIEFVKLILRERFGRVEN